MDIKGYIQRQFHISPNNIELLLRCEEKAETYFKRYEEIAQINQLRVMDAFRKNQVSSRHFYPSTGYGYGDEGREKLCEVFADALQAEKAIVSPLLMSGTHAISTALFGMLRPGNTALSITGTPYDTLKSSLWGGENGSLEDYGIRFDGIPLDKDQKIGIPAVLEYLKKNDNVRLIYIQRSTGYEVRKTFTVSEIGETVSKIRQAYPNIPVMVDNCYGEFVCDAEPTAIGADVIVGSLIKNPGGGLAPTGGYIAGRGEWIDRISHRFSAPGIGTEIGSYAYGYQPFFQGLFVAPHTVLQALKGVILAAAVFGELGYQTSPSYDEERGDITQTILFGAEGLLTAFVRGIQRASAVDGHVVPYAWDMPGYDDKVIMAAGTFVQGASIELTADAPMREPYCAYLQGALTYEHAKMGILFALDELEK